MMNARSTRLAPTRDLLSRCPNVTRASAYQSPSTAPSATELQLLQKYTNVVPDTAPSGKLQFKAKAATVSCNILSSIVASSSLGLKPYENAILTALSYDRCRSLPPAERAQCQLDKAIVNVGSLFSKDVEGRVCTCIDPRLADDAEKMVSKVHHLINLYKESEVPSNKLIFRLPATWAGVQAAKQLEAKGVATQVFLVFSLVQAVAAAQAGVSVLQVNVGQAREWFLKFPGMIRDPLGPRQDAGYMSSVDPGLLLVRQVYNYVKKFHPQTQVLVSGIRRKDDAVTLSGVDFMVLPSKVLSELDSTPTAAGYNDGLNAAGTLDESEMPVLTLRAAQKSDVEQMATVDEYFFNSGMGMAAAELLKQGLKQQVADAERFLPYFEKSTSASSSF